MVCLIRILIVLTCTVSLVALQPVSSGAVELGGTPQAVLSLDGARDLYNAGDDAAALSELRSYILNYPDSPKSAAAHTLIARILLVDGHADDAIFYLQRIPVEQQNNTSKLLLLAALQEQQQLATADQILSDLQAQMFSVADRQLFYRCKATSLVYHQQPLQALVILRKVLSAGGQFGDKSSTAVFAQIQTILQQLTPDQLAEAGFMLATTELNDAIVLYRAELAFSDGNIAVAQQLAESLIVSAQSGTARIKAASMLDKIYGQHWYRRAVGVVLPLSGRFAPFGKLIRQGIELAASQHVDSSVEFIFLDSRADPQHGEMMVRNLIDGYRVMAVIGPLTGAVAQQVTSLASSAQVPLITLSHRAGLPEHGAYIFRNCLTVEQQVAALADYAIEVLGLNTYAILYPDNGGGVEFADKFSVAIEQRGGDIEHRLQFADKGTDFRRQLLLLKGEDPDAPELSDAEKKLLEDEEELPLDFEAVFVPAYADTIAMLAPQLAYYGIKDVQLLGINGWNSPKLLQQAGRYTKGAVFADGFFVDSDDAVVVSFVDAYQEKFTDKPSILEAQAYDCANILLQIIQSDTVATPTAVQQAMVNLNNYHGVTGISGFDANGDAVRRVFLLEMGRRTLKQIKGTMNWHVTPTFY